MTQYLYNLKTLLEIHYTNTFQYTTATAPSILRLVSTGITNELVPILRYYSVACLDVIIGSHNLFL